MKENVFTVNLGKLKLTDEHKRSINAAIQAAVARELGNIVLPNDVALVPVNNYLHGPILNGIIAWEHNNILQEAQQQAL